MTKVAMRRKARREKQLIVALFLVAIAGSALGLNYYFNSPATPLTPHGTQCGVIVMPQGNITMVLYPDLVPITAQRFSGLFASGYYNGLPWHRVESWVIQTGQGNPRDPITLELNPTVHNVRGSVGAARTSDPNSATTQFYILRADQTGLDTEGGGYSVFGTVIGGMNIVDAMTVNQIITRSALVDCPS